VSCGCEAPGPSATVGPHATRSTQRRRRDHDVKAPAMTRQPDGLVKRVPVKARERSSKTSRPGSARTAPSSKPMPGISRTSPASRSSTTTPSSSPPSSMTETSSRTSLTSSPTPRLEIQASPVEQRAEVRLGAVAQHRCPHLVPARRSPRSGGTFPNNPPSCRDQPIRSRNSSSALPTFCSRLASTTVRSGLATYQALAGNWCRTIKSFTSGLRIPGHPSKQVNRMSI